ncbi:MAG TPA: SCO family protein [Pseudogracilibacillus sp.]|nr:SCO family protein [Pseudogracilibacillus sp.]
MKHKHQMISLTVVILFGLIIFYTGTNGFTAFTAETARTNKLITDQPIVPDVILEDSLENEFHFSDLQGKYVFMTFFYTSCSTVCPQLEMNVKEVYNQVPETYLEEDVVFLSVSFDPDRDTPEVLEKYRDYFETDEDEWLMARVKDEHQLDNLLDELGVIAIPDGDEEFTHNVAFYLVDPDGILIDIMDYQETELAGEKLNDVLQGSDEI